MPIGLVFIQEVLHAHTRMITATEKSHNRSQQCCSCC